MLKIAFSNYSLYSFAKNPIVFRAEVLPESTFLTAFVGFYTIDGNLQNWNDCQQTSRKGIYAFLSSIRAIALSLSLTKINKSVSTKMLRSP